MKALATCAKAIVVFYLFSSLVPLLKKNEWYVRVWDFPRLQLICLGIIALAILSFSGYPKTQTKLIFGFLFLIGAGFDLYRILPYSPVWGKETKSADAAKRKSDELKILTMNVLQHNTQYEELLGLIQDKDPDLILLLEINEKWVKHLAPLEKNYALTLKKPQNNTYGIALYSKLKAEVGEIRYLVDKDVPSVFARLKLPSGEMFEVHGLHPRPPQVQTKTTTDRDAELIIVAKAAAQSDFPTIVMGDLNDVAWSHTTRLFRRISGLLDPRVGRGAYATFPAGVPFFHFPLDYVFSSDEWFLKNFQVLPNIGSDHHPVFISFHFNRSAQAQQEAPDKEEGDEKEAEEAIDRAQKKDRTK